jgi:rRNA maturation RNase YbeY
MAVHYFEEEVKARLQNRRRLSAFLERKIKEYSTPEQINLNYIFCKDDFLLEKNKAFLQHDTFTDILTFDLSEKQEELDAEIYISIDRIKENAAEFGSPYQEELHRVIFHGILHLCGFKDKTPEDKTVMRTKEQECLHQYFSPE